MNDYIRFTVVRHRCFNTRSTRVVYIISRSKKEKSDAYKFKNKFDKFQQIPNLKILNKTKSIYCSQTRLYDIGYICICM